MEKIKSRNHWEKCVKESRDGRGIACTTPPHDLLMERKTFEDEDKSTQEYLKNSARRSEVERMRRENHCKDAFSFKAYKEHIQELESKQDDRLEKFYDRMDTSIQRAILRGNNRISFCEGIDFEWFDRDALVKQFTGVGYKIKLSSSGGETYLTVSWKHLV